MVQKSNLKAVKKKKLSWNQEKKKSRARIGKPAKNPKKQSLSTAFNKNKKLTTAINQKIERSLLEKASKSGDATDIVKPVAAGASSAKLKYNSKKQFKL
mmetsp:Transcript_43376/g.169765  ORF Transcript_43376/g.169765 Transcript_43376/m.169765 type:complete len:99 (+) Transcript_43376:409-705(+)